MTQYTIQYGKFNAESGQIEYATNKIHTGGGVIINPSVETLVALGYKPIAEDEKPVVTDGYSLEEYIVDEPEYIHIMYRLVKDELPPEPDGLNDE